jgi:uncharacterized protein GlcG (DUF336 family)
MDRLVQSLEVVVPEAAGASTRSKGKKVEVAVVDDSGDMVVYDPPVSRFDPVVN